MQVEEKERIFLETSESIRYASTVLYSIFQTLTECKGCSHLDSAIDSASRLGAQK